MAPPGGGPRPSLISVVCFKETPEASLGLTFRSVDGVLKIAGINPERPLAKTPLRAGDEVIGLEGHRHCSRWTAVEAVRFVKYRVGHFSMLVRNPGGDPNLHEAVVFKGKPDDLVGLAFDSDLQGRLMIKSLNHEALIGKMSALNVGDFVESINLTPAQNLDSQVARTMVRTIPDVVSIVTKRTDAVQLSVRYLDGAAAADDEGTASPGHAHVGATEVDATASEVSVIDPHSHGTGGVVMEWEDGEGPVEPRFVYVQCEKPTIDTKLGISFDDSDGTLTIASINGSGVLWASPLKAGFEVMAIDGRVCTSWTKAATMEYFKSRQTDITILARNPVGNACYVVAQAPKFSPRAKVGLSFRKQGSGPLRIGLVNQDSIYAGSILNEEDDVISINGVSARILTTSEAVSIVELATDTVTILARTNSRNGIVLASLGPGVIPAELLTATQMAAPERSSQNSSIAVCVCICIAAVFFFVVGLCKSRAGWDRPALCFRMMMLYDCASRSIGPDHQCLNCCSNCENISPAHPIIV